MTDSKEVEYFGDESPQEKEVAASSEGSGHGSSRRAGMESSVFRFSNINFHVGSGDDQKHILSDVSAVVPWGRVLAIMGPSGAGKTVLISALTLDATFGKTTGTAKLNGVPLTDRIFKTHSYVVVQQDKHWPNLTCRETLLYAAELYSVASTASELDAIVNEIITKMGLDVCAETRNARLSGGQARRLSIALALLKQPTLLFLDEPTTGLDAAAAENIMQEIVRVAKEERIIIICTIHQPSTKVYNGFDQVMILSKGREAFTGKVDDAVPYFENIGYPLPVQTNPAEHFLDLVNADFSDDAAVNKILDAWEEQRPEAHSTHHKKSLQDESDGVTDLQGASLMTSIGIMFRRCAIMIVRDPILYVGRAVVFLVANLIFSLVYLKARQHDQDQAANKLWITLWHVAVACNMGVVAVYALNDEFKTIVRETKNGMVQPLSYVLAKTVLVLPIMIIFAIFALGIPTFAIMDFPGQNFAPILITWALIVYIFECVAESLSVWMDDPILGMMQFMNFWFGSFLFAGFLIPKRDMFWPFTAFYYVMPYSYYVRTQMYNELKDMTFSECDPATAVAICAHPPTGLNVLEQLGRAYAVVSNDVNVGENLAILAAIAVFWKMVYIVGVFYKTSRSSNIVEQ